MERIAYSPDEVAVLLGISRSSVWRWIRSGELPAGRIGGRVLIPSEALRDRLAEPRATNAESSPSASEELDR
jgi:excisionase family DNA binding protein